MPSYRGFDARNYLLNGSPSATLVENFPRDQITTDLTASLVTAVMTSVAVPLLQGDTVTTIGFVSGATAAGTPTNEWVALYSTAATPALLGQSTSVSTAWGTNALKAFTLTTAYVVPATGVYYAALCVVATVVPTLVGKVVGSAAALLAATGVVTGQTALAQNSGSALTTTAPATIAAPTVQSVVPYCVIQ